MSSDDERAPTPRDHRAAARDERRNFLQVPSHGLGRADIIRSRSPSPAAGAQRAFEFPSNEPPRPEEEQFEDAAAHTSNDNMSLSVDDIIKIATASAKAAAQEMAASIRAPAPDADANADALAAAPAATTSSSNNHIKKVELPSFDKKNIHTWIRRVEAAFGRAGVTLAKDKFFFIEAKLDVNLNPKVNEFLCGESTDETWDTFLEYLQEEYGKTKEQQAALFLKGIPRDNLRPTQHLAKIKDLIKDIELNDLIKEMVLQELPSTVRQTLAERPDLSAEAAAKAADCYFDKDGRPKHSVGTASVSNVDQCPGLVDTEDEADQINAIPRGKFRGGFNGRGRNRQQRSQQPQRNFTPAFSDSQNATNKPKTDVNKKPSLRQICRFHLQFGEKAFNCEPGCQYKPKNQQSQNSQSGNGTAGRRT